MKIGAIASAPDILFHHTAPVMDANEKGNVYAARSDAEAKEKQNNAEAKTIEESEANPIAGANVTRLGKKTTFPELSKG